MTPIAALIFLPFVLFVCIWVAWSDMKFMKIPNRAVIALGVVYLGVGVFVLPWPLWFWGMALGAGVLGIGFVITALGLVGAGDAKFAAAMAPFFVAGQPNLILALFGACLLTAFFTHRLVKWTPPLRKVVADWQSWTHKDFPMGLALSSTLIIYLVLQIWPLFARGSV